MDSQTQDMKSKAILTFEEARTRSTDCSYDKSRWLYIPDFYADYRYILGTVGKKPLITIGVNPSTASPQRLDNTLKSVERIAFGNAYDSFIMFNLYPQRATNPNDMNQEINAMLHKENLKAFRFILQHGGLQPSIWAAWGTLIEKRAYLRDCLLEMVQLAKGYDAQWCRTGNLSKKGHPHHPLYLKKDSKLEPFDIDEYLQKL